MVGVAATTAVRLIRTPWRRAVGEVVGAVRMLRLARRRVVAAKASVEGRERRTGRKGGTVCEAAATAARLL